MNLDRYLLALTGDTIYSKLILKYINSKVNQTKNPKDGPRDF